MNKKRQTVWLVSMLSIMVVLSAYYLFTDDGGDVDQAANGDANSIVVDLLNDEGMLEWTDDMTTALEDANPTGDKAAEETDKADEETAAAAEATDMAAEETMADEETTQDSATPDPVETLRSWVNTMSQNGIRQHSEEWHNRRQFMIGGSSIATIQGRNPFCSLRDFLAERVGLKEHRSTIYTQWGCLFEQVIKKYTENKLGCEIMGSDLFICEGDSVSYSPDGLGVVENQIVLFEFKCPFNRIPSHSGPPKYYIPQVKMGLDLLKIPEYALFVEGVFRRCSLEQLGLGKEYDTSLHLSKAGTVRSPGGRAGAQPVAFGVIGFYCQNYRDLVEFVLSFGHDALDKLSWDFGSVPVDTFKQIMEAFNSQRILPWYGEISDVNKRMTSETYEQIFRDFCAKSKVHPVGVLPWKLFKVEMHRVEKTEQYLQPWLGVIKDVTEFLQKCCAAPMDQRQKMIDDYLVSLQDDTFDD